MLMSSEIDQFNNTSARYMCEICVWMYVTWALRRKFVLYKESIWTLCDIRNKQVCLAFAFIGDLLKHDIFLYI